MIRFGKQRQADYEAVRVGAVTYHELKSHVARYEAPLHGGNVRRREKRWRRNKNHLALHETEEERAHQLELGISEVVASIGLPPAPRRHANKVEDGGQVRTVLTLSGEERESD